MSASGTVLLDFGAFPGASDASVAVASAGIGAGSLVEAWIFPAATADHTADEHIVETLRVFAGNIVAGVGFTVYGVNVNQLYEALIDGSPSTFRTAAATTFGMSPAAEGGYAPLIYGKWNIGWVWA